MPRCSQLDQYLALNVEVPAKIFHSSICTQHMVSLINHNVIRVYLMSIIRLLHNKSNSLSSYHSFRDHLLSNASKTITLEKQKARVAYPPVRGISRKRNNVVGDLHHFNHARGVYQQSRSYNLHKDPQMYLAM